MSKLRNFVSKWKNVTNKSNVLIFVTLFAFFLITSVFSISNAQSRKGKVKSVNTNVSVFLGKSRFVVFGYTSPFANVSIQGMGVYYEAVADEMGFFIFDNEFSPLSSREMCLTAQDTAGRISQPVCLPPFPIDKNVRIGPVILPPTISVNQSNFLLNDPGILNGQTVPHSNVNISFFKDKNNSDVSFPNIATQANSQGYFSLTFPTQRSNTYRSFASTKFKDNASGKSNTLTIDVLPLWKLILTTLILLLRALLKNVLPFVILIESLILLLFLIPFKRKHQKYPLALRPEHFLEEKE